MPLERREISFNGTLYSRLIGREIESLGDVKELVPFLAGGDYFYGGVLDTSPNPQVFFGQGPSHDIFCQMVQQMSEKIDFVYSCQIGIDNTWHISHILFVQDPGRNCEGVVIDASPDEAQRRRLQRIRTVVEALPPSICTSRIEIGWFGEVNHMREYIYLHREKHLSKINN